MVFTSGVHRFKLGTSSGPEAVQKTSQGTPRPATTYLGLVDLCGGARSQGDFRARPVAFIKLKQIKIWTCRGRAQNRNGGVGWVCKGKIILTPKPQNSVSLCLSLPP